jgi:thioredoxin-related protein
MYHRLAIIFRAIVTAICLLTLSTSVRAETVLMMAEEPGCVWCARWNTEIGPIYPKTGEGRAARLRRVDITQTLPEDITLARRVNFTPTFVLLDNGTELARLEGYPGEDFFWGLLSRMLDENGINYDAR